MHHRPAGGGKRLPRRRPGQRTGGRFSIGGGLTLDTEFSTLVSELTIEELARLRDLANDRLAREGKLCVRCQGPMGYDDESDICTGCVWAIYLKVEWKHALARRDPVALAAAGWKLATHRLPFRTRRR